MGMDEVQLVLEGDWYLKLSLFSTQKKVKPKIIFLG